MAGILDIIIPKEGKFFEMLKDLAEGARRGAELFVKLATEYATLKSSERAAIIGELKALERSCDNLTHRIVIELNRTFITPIDREDIHKLATMMDDTIDSFCDTSQKMQLYGIKKIPPHFEELAKLAADCVTEINLLVTKLGKKKKVGMHIIRIHSLENMADDEMNRALSYMFNDSLDPVQITKLKDLYERLEAVTNRCEDIADLIETIVIKHA